MADAPPLLVNGFVKSKLNTLTFCVTKMVCPKYIDSSAREEYYVVDL